MSEQATLISAALRHARDAEHLAEPGPTRSLDQAFHLAGFGPECVRKACLTGRWADKVLSHGMDVATELVVDWILALDAHASRYGIRDWSARYAALRVWKVESRYEATGQRTEQEVHALLAVAREAVDSTILRLWTGGAINAEELV